LPFISPQRGEEAKIEMMFPHGPRLDAWCAWVGSFLEKAILTVSPAPMNALPTTPELRIKWKKLGDPENDPFFDNSLALATVK
jgi:hypothetical protein